MYKDEHELNRIEMKTHVSYPALHFVLFDDFGESLLVTQTSGCRVQAAKLSNKHILLI